MASFIFIDNNRITIPSTTKLIKADSYSHIVAADNIITEARVKADEILSKAQTQAQKMIKETEIAYATNQRKGYQDGLERAKHEMVAEISAISLKTAQYYQAIENKIVTLVMDTVRKVIGTTDNCELITCLVKKALLIMKSHKQITIKVAPDQINFVNECLAELMNGYFHTDTIEVKGDDRIPPTDLIIQSEIGIISTGIETQLAAIEQAFVKSFPAQPAERWFDGNATANLKTASQS